MDKTFLLVIAFLAALTITNAHAESFSATGGYTCDAAIAGQWSFEAYRAEDGAYLEMISDHAPLTELSKYGMDALFLPDGDQPYHPFFAKFPDGLHTSPATSGRRFDSVATWTSPVTADATVSGFVDVRGNIKGEHNGAVVRANLLKGEDVLWSADVKGGEPAKFSLETEVEEGDKVRMRIENPDGKPGKLTVFDFTVDTK